MRTVPLVILLAASAVPLSAQQRSTLLFTGRFPFVSLDHANERPGGSISQLSEFAISMVSPGAGAFARTWVPATTQECYMGDVTGTGDYTPLAGLKTYFQRINIAGPFVRHADKARADARRFFWTVRDVEPTIDIVVQDQNGGVAVPVLPGDFVRLTSNGNVEYFITQAQFLTAAGAQTGTFAAGASALCQDAQGNLYYSPAEGGQWINGNRLVSGPEFAFDGAIVKIPASAITYDARGNVQAVQPDSAYMVFQETSPGLNGGPSMRQLVTTANAYDNSGAVLLQTTTNLVGLDLDPNGGTITAAWPLGDPSTGGTYDTLPNLVFTWDSGSWGGTIFSTANNGSIAIINGIKCGSDLSGVPADGSWLGVMSDVANFQPTLMGLQVIPEPGFAPLVADAPNFGALQPSSPFELDYLTAPNSVVGTVAQFGPLGNGSVPSSIDFNQVFGPASWNTLFTIPLAGLQPIGLPVISSAPSGYATLAFPNPVTTALVGVTLVFHGVSPAGSGVQVSNPTIVQLK